MKISSALKATSFVLLSIGPSQIVGTVGLFALIIKTIKDIAFRAYYALCLTYSKSEYYRERAHLYRKALKHDCKIALCCTQLLVPFFGVHLFSKWGAKGVQAIGKELSSNWILRSPLSWLVRTGAFPLNKALLTYAWQTFLDWPKNQLTDIIGCQPVTIPTEDGRAIQGFWAPAANPKAPAVVLFHGNAMTPTAFGSHAAQFKALGFHVLLVTMGGYPDSSEQTVTSEQTAYFDAHASVHFIKAQTALPNERLLAYGLSLGGALALEVGSAFPGMAVVTDQTFSKIREVPPNLGPKFLGILAKGMMTETFKSGIPVGKRFTDGFNNVKKVKTLQGPFFALQTNRDQLMKTKQGGNISQKVVHAYIQAQRQRGRFLDAKTVSAEFSGGHGANVWLDKSGKASLINFLIRSGFVAA